MRRHAAPFIVGTGRSGTTLLRMMLDAHSQLAVPPETNFAPALEAFWRDGIDAAVDAMVLSDQWADCNVPAAEFRDRVSERSTLDFGEALRAFYELYAERRGKPRWGDKSPYYVGAMTAIGRLLPEACFIHIVRDGRDFALSTIPLWFGPETIADAATEWVRTLELARSQATDLPHYREVRYEDLVRDPSRILRDLCEFLELDWEASMLDYHLDAEARMAAETGELRRPDRVVSPGERLAIHPLIGQPPQQHRIERWRREMSPDDVDAFERIAAAELESFGYPLSSTERVGRS